MNQSADVHALRAIIRAMAASAYAARVPGLLDAVKEVLLAKDFTSRGFCRAVNRMDRLIATAGTDVRIREGLRHH